MPLGIALVVDDSNKGQRLVFRYPALREEALKARGPLSVADRAAADFHLLSPEVFARLFRPKTALCGKPLEVVIDRICYLSYPVLTCTASKETNRDDILLFNVVLATSKVEHERGLLMDAVPGAGRKRRLKPATPGSSGTRMSARKEVFQQVLARLAQGLLHEERRVRYLSREVVILLQTREEVFGKEGWGGDQVQTMLDLMLERSALANDLRRVFHGLKNSGGPRQQQQDVLLNGWIPLGIPTCTAAAAACPFPREPGSAPGTALRPYQTVVLTSDEESLLKRIPRDGSQQLAAVIKALDPLKTIEEISVLAQISLPQLELLIRHLVALGQAKVTSAISLQSMYAVKPSAPTMLNSLEAIGFQQVFSSERDSLFQVLAKFGSGRTLKSLMKGLKEEEQAELLAKVVWLLQHDFIQELHTYVHCTLSPDDPVAARSLSPSLRKLLQNGHLDGSKHLLELLWTEPNTDKADFFRSINDPASPFVVTIRPSPEQEYS